MSMFFIILVLTQFILLFFLSRVFTRTLSRFLYKITKNETLTIQIMSFLLLPGVVVHELSHILAATILLVPLGEVEFFPRVVEGNVKLGSVAIAKTDPLRRAIIGLAPIVVGVSVLVAAAAFYSQSSYELISWPSLILFYAVFEVGNTMFSSTRDLEGLIETLIAGGILVGVIYVFSVLSGINIPQIALPAIDIGNFLSPLIMTFGVAIGIDVTMILFLRIINGERRAF